MNGLLWGLATLLGRLLGPLSTSNVTLVALALIALALLALLFFMPTVETILMRSGFGISGRNRITNRMLRQAQALRPSRERSFSARLRENLYRDGRAGAPIDTGSDFFTFFQLVFGFIFLILGFLLTVVGNGSPFYLALAFAGFFAPWLVATLHNRNRRAAIVAELPRALPRMATQLDMEPDLKTVFAKVAQSGVGPLYEEFQWAAGQMAIAARSVYDVMRDLDRRNALPPFFGPMADEAEREARGSDAKMKAAIRENIVLALDEHYARAEQRLGSIGNQATVAVALPMLAGVLAAILGPLILQLIGQLSQVISPH
jgi:pilus assembly protein TadC